MKQAKQAWMHFRKGIYYQFPLCCVLTFSICELLSPRAQAICRGSIPIKKRPGATCVACRLHQRHPDWKPYYEPLSILGEKDPSRPGGVRWIYVGELAEDADKFVKV